MKVGQLAWYVPPPRSAMSPNHGRLVRLKQDMGTPTGLFVWGLAIMSNDNRHHLWRVECVGSPLDLSRLDLAFGPLFASSVDPVLFPCQARHLIPLPDFPEESESPSAERPINSSNGV